MNHSFNYTHGFLTVSLISSLAFCFQGSFSHLAKPDSISNVEGAQSKQPATNEIIVKSWKTGSRKIEKQSYTFELTSRKNSDDAIIKDESGQPRYFLAIASGLIGRPEFPIDYYKVTLKEIIKMSKDYMDLDKNLLAQEEPGSGQDNIPLGDFVGIFYPFEDVKFLKRGVSGFPLSAKRVIKIESFYCFIQAKEYKLNPTQPGKFDSLTISLTFKDSYD